MGTRNDDAKAAALRRQFDLLTEEETASLFGVTVATGRNRQAAGTYPEHSSTGKQKLFERSVVLAWLRRNRVSRKVA